MPRPWGTDWAETAFYFVGTGTIVRIWWVNAAAGIFCKLERKLLVGFLLAI